MQKKKIQNINKAFYKQKKNIQRGKKIYNIKIT